MKKILVVGLTLSALVLIGCSQNANPVSDTTSQDQPSSVNTGTPLITPIAEPETSQADNNLVYSDKDISFNYLNGFKVIKQDNFIYISPENLSAGQYPDEGTSLYEISIYKTLKEADQKRNAIEMNTNRNNNLCLTLLQDTEVIKCKFEQTTDEGMSGVGQYYEIIAPKNNIWVFIFDKSGNSDFVEKVLLSSFKLNK